MKAYAVIMAGGIGSRFWPMSTASHPKQFHDVLGTGESLLQQTYRRLSGLCQPENILVVTNQQYVGLVAGQLPGLPAHNILSEPSRRNTAPCLAYAVAKIGRRDPNATMVVCPSDHLVTKEEEYLRILGRCLDAASTSQELFTLGIKPNRPDTGYGYIQFGSDTLPGFDDIHTVRTFAEKPDLENAIAFFESGEFLWNAGIFVWSVGAIRTALQRHMPELIASFDQGMGVYDTPEEEAFVAEVYSSAENQSIDYGIMEKADNVYVLPAEFGWSDLGTWGSLYEHKTKDDKGNAVIAPKALLYDCEGTIVRAPAHKIVVLEGLTDFIVVDEGDRLLVCHRHNEQAIKSFVNDLRIRFDEDHG
ncbi:NTP transferase domain-containing protein [bacterium]|nr:NTP transferase domain-containing protein [bacterium]